MISGARPLLGDRPCGVLNAVPGTCQEQAASGRHDGWISSAGEFGAGVIEVP